MSIQRERSGLKYPACPNRSVLVTREEDVAVSELQQDPWQRSQQRPARQAERPADAVLCRHAGRGEHEQPREDGEERLLRPREERETQETAENHRTDEHSGAPENAPRE